MECWNGVRGIDYLPVAADVDPKRIAVTGISGGGAATFWIAAADPRVKVAVPVSGMADLRSYVTQPGNQRPLRLHVLLQHVPVALDTDRGAGCPRPLLFANSDHDKIFPMDANDRVINRAEAGL